MAINFFKKKQDTFDYEQERICKNCAYEYKGRFCCRCGQKVVEPNERTVSHFLGHIFNAFTFVDSKLWNSLKSMIVSPGQMSRDILDGKGKRYMKPVGLFFVGNLIYFLMPIFQTFDTSLYSQMGYMVYSDVLSISEVVQNRIILDNITLEEFADSYASKSKEISKTILILFAVLLSLFTSIINFSKKNLFSDHILFGLELSSFVIHYITIILGVIFLSMGWLLSFFMDDANLIRDDDIFFVVGVPIFFYFVIRGIKTFYGVSWFNSLIKSFISFLALVASVELYRLMVFTLTMLSL